MTKVNKTPAEIFKPLEPHSHFRFSVNYGDWRFRIECKMKSEKFKYPYHHGSFSKSFAKDKSMWKDCLKECHRHCWEKFSLVRDELDPHGEIPLQSPGEIPESVYKEIEEKIMDTLKPPKVYAKLE